MLEEIINEQYLYMLQVHKLSHVLAALCCHKICTYTASWIVLSYKKWAYCLC